eukprot:93109_1
MAQEAQATFDNYCQSTATCSSIKRIISYLNQYQNVDDINEVYKLFNNKKTPYLSNDFNHVLMYHLGDNKSTLESANEYESIHNLIQDKVTNCDLSKCAKFLRNNRNRETDIIKLKLKDKNNAKYYIDTMDCIHSYFMHSFDVGFRIKQSELDNIIIQSENKQNENNDNQLIQDAIVPKLSILLQNKREKMKNICGLARIENTKYVTSVNSFTTDTSQHSIESKIDINIAENEVVKTVVE